MRVLDTVLRSSAQAIAIADSSAKITFANAAFCRLWRHPEGESPLGRSIFEFWESSDDPTTTLERVRIEGTRSIERPATRMDGSSFYLNVTAEAVCDAGGLLTQVLVTFTDVTDRKRLEAQLLHAQKWSPSGASPAVWRMTSTTCSP